MPGTDLREHQHFLMLSRIGGSKGDGWRRSGKNNVVKRVSEGTFNHSICHKQVKMKNLLTLAAGSS